MAKAKKVLLVTRDSLQAMLDNPNPRYVEQVVGRALSQIFEYQTSDEKASNATRLHNNVGFTATDAKSGSLTAKTFKRHGKLESWQISRWTKKDDKGYSRLSKYHRQLNAIAELKAARGE